MTAHTPGPWLVLPNPPQRGMTLVGDYNGGKGPYRGLIDCSPRACLYLGASLAVAREEAEANARLVAAGPDLLEALESLVAICTHASVSRRPPAPVAVARAAIAKARGDEPRGNPRPSPPDLETKP